MEKLNTLALEIDAEENELIKIGMNGKITDDKFDLYTKELEKRRIKTKLDREKYQQADKVFKDTAITAFRLISRGYELFEGSKNDQKRQLINFVFLNLKLNGQKLEYTLRSPFNLLVNLEACTSWRTERDSNPR